MTLSELKRQVDLFVDIGHGDDTVLINLSERSVGAKASAGITSLAPGIDWEHGQIRIHTDKKIISDHLNRDLVIPPVEIDYDYGVKAYHVLHCPKCENKLRKDDKYCSLCGQRVK